MTYQRVCSSVDEILYSIETGEKFTLAFPQSTLSLRRKNIGAEGTKRLANALQGNSTITSLDLHNNSMGDEGLCALSDILKGNNTLTMIWLSSNKIGPRGAKAFSEVLQGNTALTQILIGGNLIADEGAKAIAEALKYNSSVKTLWLDYNKIGQEGIIALSSALKENTSLNVLYLFGNASVGESAILSALKQNCTLTTLHLSTYTKGILQEMQLNKELRLMMKWPHAHSKLNTYWIRKIIEICCCSNGIPNEILHILLHSIFIVEFKIRRCVPPGHSGLL